MMLHRLSSILFMQHQKGVTVTDTGATTCYIPYGALRMIGPVRSAKPCTADRPLTAQKVRSFSHYEEDICIRNIDLLIAPLTSPEYSFLQ